MVHRGTKQDRLLADIQQLATLFFFPMTISLFNVNLVLSQLLVAFFHSFLIISSCLLICLLAWLFAWLVAWLLGCLVAWLVAEFINDLQSNGLAQNQQRAHHHYLSLSFSIKNSLN